MESREHVGRAWFLLGILRLTLLAPTAGTDPAAEPCLEREAVLHQIDTWLAPEKKVKAFNLDKSQCGSSNH